MAVCQEMSAMKQLLLTLSAQPPESRQPLQQQMRRPRPGTSGGDAVSVKAKPRSSQVTFEKAERDDNNAVYMPQPTQFVSNS